MRKRVIFAFVIALAGMAFVLFRSAEPAGTIILSDAQAQMSTQAEGAVDIFLGLQNGAQPDRLLGVASAWASDAQIVSPAGVTALPVPAGGVSSLAADGAHLRLSGFDAPPEAGQLIPLALTFEKAGVLNTRALLGDGPAPSADPHAGHMMQMRQGDLTAEGVPPTVALDIAPQAGGAWAVGLQTSDFTFDPDMPDPVHVPSHGHAHLYLDGLKIARMHAPEAMIGALLPGRYTVSVALNSNDHRPYRDAAGQPVQASATLVVD